MKVGRASLRDNGAYKLSMLIIAFSTGMGILGTFLTGYPRNIQSAFIFSFAFGEIALVLLAAFLAKRNRIIVFRND